MDDFDDPLLPRQVWANERCPHADDGISGYEGFRSGRWSTGAAYRPAQCLFRRQILRYRENVGCGEEMTCHDGHRLARVIGDDRLDSDVAPSGVHGGLIGEVENPHRALGGKEAPSRMCRSRGRCSDYWLYRSDSYRARADAYVIGQPHALTTGLSQRYLTNRRPRFAIVS